MGLEFELHAHGKGPEQFSSTAGGIVLEIYPARSAQDITNKTRLGLHVASVDDTVESLRSINFEIVSELKDSEWGRRAIVRDFDGHAIEFMASPKCEISGRRLAKLR